MPLPCCQDVLVIWLVVECCVATCACAPLQMARQLLLPPEDLSVKQRERLYQSVLKHASLYIDALIVVCIDLWFSVCLCSYAVQLMLLLCLYIVTIVDVVFAA